MELLNYTNISIYLFLLIAILIISSTIYIVYIINRRKIYKTYLKKQGPLSGMEAASLMMKREGYKSKFAIYKGNKLDPFYGNFFLPDKNVFIMKREIMDGKNLMALCIGCQLASSALRYRNGDMCKDVSTNFETDYALKYKLKKDELKELEENTASTSIQRY